MMKPLPFFRLKAPVLAVVLIATATLTACGGGMELQKDGSGSDEMLRSPCGCMPVPYDPPKFKWGIG